MPKENNDYVISNSVKKRKSRNKEKVNNYEKTKPIKRLLLLFANTTFQNACFSNLFFRFNYNEKVCDPQRTSCGMPIMADAN